MAVCWAVATTTTTTRRRGSESGEGVETALQRVQALSDDKFEVEIEVGVEVEDDVEVDVEVAVGGWRWKDVGCLLSVCLQSGLFLLVAIDGHRPRADGRGGLAS